MPAHVLKLLVVFHMFSQCNNRFTDTSACVCFFFLFVCLLIFPGSAL